MNIQALSIAVTVVLAFVGLVGKYVYDLRLARRKDALELVNRRLNEFYGPLYVSSKAGRVAISALCSRLGQEHVFVNRSAPAEYELNEWKIWLPAVLTPINEFREQLILKNSHLIRETEFPECLVKFVAHVAAYKAVLRKWELQDYSEVLSIIDFPKELDRYAERSYLELKAEQARLIGR
jgi:hypothetical protein